MNTVQLVGRLTRDPDVSVGKNSGTTIARFTVACDRRGKDQGADFISCLAFKQTADFIEKYFHKGSRIGLTGTIRTGSYDNKDGKKVYTTDIWVDNVEFVESKASAVAAEPAKKDDGFMAVDENLDDEMPFK